MVTEDGSRQPILRDKQYEDESQFTPESLVHEARRQKALREARVPQVSFSIPTATSSDIYAPQVGRGST
jgi:hypothetical protein